MTSKCHGMSMGLVNTEAGMQMNAGQSGMALSKESSTSYTSKRESEMAFSGVSSSNWRKDDIVTAVTSTRFGHAITWLSLWLLVMFPANFFSFLVDELARLAVWLTVGISTQLDPNVIVVTCW